MIFKLCYLYTFITATLNVIGVTALSWQMVFMPSIIALIISAILFIFALVITVLASKK